MVARDLAHLALWPLGSQTRGNLGLAGLAYPRQQRASNAPATPADVDERQRTPRRPCGQISRSDEHLRTAADADPPVFKTAATGRQAQASCSSRFHQHRPQPWATRLATDPRGMLLVDQEMPRSGGVGEERVRTLKTGHKANRTLRTGPKGLTPQSPMIRPAAGSLLERACTGTPAARRPALRLSTAQEPAFGAPRRERGPLAQHRHSVRLGQIGLPPYRRRKPAATACVLALPDFSERTGVPLRRLLPHQIWAIGGGDLGLGVEREDAMGARFATY